MGDYAAGHPHRYFSLDASCSTCDLWYDQSLSAAISAVVGTLYTLLSGSDVFASFPYRSYFRSSSAMALLASKNGTGISVAALGSSRVYHTLTGCDTLQESILYADGSCVCLCGVSVRLDLFDLILFVKQIAEPEAMQEDGPGDVDPQKEEEYGTDAAIDGSVGLVVHDIEDKAAFGEIPDE